MAKNTTVEVKGVPEEGYELEYVKANGVMAADNKFIVDRATEVTAKFRMVDGIKEISETVSARGGKNVIYLDAENSFVQIYTTDGVRVYENKIRGSVSVPLSPGTYIVRWVTAGNTLSHLVTVRW